MRSNVERALVLGGTGAVGCEVLRRLAAAEVPTVFTYHRNADKAQALSTEYGHRAVQIDLAEPENIRRFFDQLDEAAEMPSVVIHCAAIARSSKLRDIDDDEWATVQAVNCYSALVTARAVAPHMRERGQGDIVLVGALDRGQSLPLPIAYAASQGTLSALSMALAKELGPSGIRVNMVALGLLNAGLSTAISAELLEQYVAFSALRRLGEPREAAEAILWLALENTYMSGKIMAANGGI